MVCYNLTLFINRINYAFNTYLTTSLCLEGIMNIEYNNFLIIHLPYFNFIIRRVYL